ncbi:MAG: hypothetical protein HOH22_12790 [Rhodospirillaceae bacterium]|nr:hypothetical protein [Rhodospirillaceae bacterium]MBT7509016.1 hypothetical protein [Rhodospirillaceae bacterium]
MISSLIKGIRQLSDPATRQVVWLSVGLAILTFLFLFACIETLLSETSFFQAGWLETFADVLGRLAAIVLAWLLFPAAISAVVGLYLERVAAAVEARHYPSLAPAPEQDFIVTLAASGKFLAIMVALNLCLLVFIFTGPLYAILFYAVNGYLISREFFELVALRRLRPEAARALRKSHQTPLFVTGAFFAFMMTMPVINLLTPVIATATMVHLFEDWRDADGAALVTA